MTPDITPDIKCVSFPPVTDITSLVPTIDQILPSFTAASFIPKEVLALYNLDIRSLIPAIPALPTIPTPLTWPSINAPSMEGLMLSAGVLKYQYLGVINELLIKLMDFAGLVPIPEIPGLPGFNLAKLLSLSITEIMNQFKLPEFNLDALLSLCPPLFPTLNIPDWRNLLAVQFAVSQYQFMLIDIVEELISKVTDILEIAGMPKLPLFPTMDQLLAMLPDYKNVTIDDIMNLSIPGFPNPLLVMPKPLVGDFTIPNFEVTYALQQLQDSMASHALVRILDFVDRLPISFNFPTIAMLLGTIPPIPDVCWLTENIV